ncbi:hypothetical protein COOONC_06769 [Cooperia oncophora]
MSSIVSIVLRDQSDIPVRLRLRTESSEPYQGIDSTALQFSNRDEEVDVDILVGIDYYWSIIDPLKPRTIDKMGKDADHDGQLDGQGRSTKLGTASTTTTPILQHRQVNQHLATSHQVAVSSSMVSMVNQSNGQRRMESGGFRRNSVTSIFGSP